MVGSLDLDLYYLGNRDYVNGLTLFEEMLKGYSKFPHPDIAAPSMIKLFQVNRFIRNDVSIEIYKSKDIKKHPILKAASARIDLRTLLSDFSILLFEKPGQSVTKQISDYDRGIYIEEAEHSKNGGSFAKLANIKNVFDLMRAIVEVNYRFVKEDSKNTGKNDTPSWAYSSNFLFYDKLEVSRISTVHYKLKNIYEAYGKRFYIRTVHIEGRKGDIISDICFFI